MMTPMFCSCIVLLALAREPERAAPNTDLFLQDVAQQRGDAPRRIRPWKQKAALGAQAVTRAKSGAINPKLQRDMSLPIGERQKLTFRNKEVKEAYIRQTSSEAAKSKQMLSGLQSGAIPLPPYIRLPLSVGQVGVLEPVDGPSVEIIQVIDEHNMIAKIRFDSRGNGRPEREFVWVRGASTKGVADDTAFEATGDCIYHIIGTKTYSTVRGSKTAMVLEPIDEQAWLKLVAETKK